MATRNDQNLEQEVQDILTHAGFVLDVSVTRAEVTVTGTVVSEADRQAALELVRSIRGIEKIDDQTEIEITAPERVYDEPDPDSDFDYAGSQAVDDAERLADYDPDLSEDIGAGTADVAEAVEEAEPYFPPTDPVVRPSTDDQELEITGGFQDTSMDEVSHEERLDASEFDPQVPGGAQLRDDESILDDIERELNEDAATADLKLEVVVSNGVVTIRGTVPSLEDAVAAEEVASRVPGVREILEETMLDQ